MKIKFVKIRFENNIINEFISFAQDNFENIEIEIYYNRAGDDDCYMEIYLNINNKKRFCVCDYYTGDKIVETDLEHDKLDSNKYEWNEEFRNYLLSLK